MKCRGNRVYVKKIVIITGGRSGIGLATAKKNDF